MSINAYDKFMTVIKRQLENCVLENIRNIDNRTELLNMLARTPYNLKLLESFSSITQVWGVEYTYQNGLKYLDSVISYDNKKWNNKIQVIRQISIFDSYKNKPLVNIAVMKDKKSYVQLLTKAKIEDDVFSDQEKDILINKIKVEVEGVCYSAFKTYKNINNNSLMLEKFIQYSSLDNTKNESLLKMCGSGDRSLDIIYRCDIPIYAQFSKGNDIKEVGVNPSNRIDVGNVVELINTYVDDLNSLISSSIKEHIIVADQKNLTKRNVV